MERSSLDAGDDLLRFGNHRRQHFLVVPRNTDHVVRHATPVILGFQLPSMTF